MTSVQPRGPDGFHHPATEEQLVALVDLARRRRCALRVRGSAHSIAPAIYSDAYLARRPLAIDVMLDRYQRVSFDDARMQVTVEAGCHLGLDPRDPSGASTWEGSLLAQLDARGWALPDLGGVTHQTVAGFLMTGSAGGSVTHAFEDALLAIRFIDGTGTIHDAVRDRGELFDAVACSMGLLGVISTVTLQCLPRYDVVGQETITTERACPYDAFGDGPGGLASFLRRTEYARLMWWPQPRVERIATWQARRMVDADYTAETGPRGALRPKRYDTFGDNLPHPRLARPLSQASQWIGGAFYDAVDAVTYGYRRAEASLPALAPVGRAALALHEEQLLPAVLGQFVPLDTRGPQRFWDAWYDGLPMDNQMSESSLPTTFTEIWIPLDDAAKAMRALRESFREEGLRATGSYAFEIYAARATRAWLHPGHGRDSLRIDVFWLERNREAPARFFSRFWDLLAPFGYRLHWGKHLPDDRARCSAYLRGQFPRWDDFLRLRAELDPHGIFLNEHFRSALGIREMPASPHEGEPPQRRNIFVTTQRSTNGSLPARIEAFYEELSVSREAALDRIGELFADDIEYRDMFRETRGLAAFRVLFDRMLRQYKEVAFTDFRCAGTEEQGFTLTYDMHLRMALGPSFVTPMASVFTVRDGKVATLGDYYDLASGLVSPLGLTVRAYRWFANTFFL